MKKFYSVLITALLLITSGASAQTLFRGAQTYDYSTLRSYPLSDTATMIVLHHGDSVNFPSGKQKVQLFADPGTLHEIINVSSRRGDTLFVSARAQENTTKHVWYAGTWISSVATLGQIEAIDSNVESLLSSSGLPDQTGAANKYLKSNGTTASWSLVSLANGVTGTLPPANGGLGLTSVATGQMPYASASNTYGLVTVGTNGQILTLSGGLPVWADNTGPSGSGSPFIVAYPSTPSAISTVEAGSHDRLALGSGGIITSGSLNQTPYELTIGKARASGFGSIAVMTGTDSTNRYAVGGVRYVPGSFSGVDSNSPAGGNSISLGWGSQASAEDAFAANGRASFVSVGIQGLALGEFDLAIGQNTTTLSNYCGGISCPGLILNSNGYTFAIATLPGASVRGRNLGLAGNSGQLAFGTGGITETGLKDMSLGGNLSDISSDYGATINCIGGDVRGYHQTTMGSYPAIHATASLTVYDSTGDILTMGNGTGATDERDAFRFTYNKIMYAGTVQVTDYTGHVLPASLASAVPETLGGTNQTAYTTGDMLYASGSNTLAKRAIGSTGNVLTVAGGVPTWAAPASAPVTSVFGRTGVVVAASNDYNFNQLAGSATIAQAGTGITTYTTGQLLYASATNILSALNIGSTGNVLTVAGGVPTWAASSSGNAYFVAPGTPTTAPTVTSSTDGVAEGSGATTTTGARAWALGNSYASGADALAGQNQDHTGTYGAQGAGSIALGKQAKATIATTVVVGGSNNAVTSGASSGIFSGTSNVITGNNISNDNSVITGGTGNTISGSGTTVQTIAGGQSNTISGGGWVGLLGGFANSASSSYSAISSGEANVNRPAADHSFIGGGKTDSTSSPFGAAFGLGTKSHGYGQVVLGQYNAVNPTTASTSYTAADPLLVIGNGTGFATRSSALEITGSGLVRIKAIGGGLQIAEGSNATMGLATLSGGTVTVSTTAVTANSRIFLTHQSISGTVGTPYISTRTGGTSFVITSTSGTDASTVAWIIIEPQ